MFYIIIAWMGYMIAISILLALVFTFFIISLTHFPNRPSFLLATYLIFFSHIVVVFLLANAFHFLNNQWFVLACQFTLALIAGGIWLLAGRPSLRYLLPHRWQIFKRLPHDTAGWLPVVLLGVGVFAAFLLCAMVIIIVAPNNVDALAAHLARIGFWLQHNSLSPWSTFDYREPTYPINASLQVFWTVLFWGTDRLAGFVQWTSGIVTILCVFGLSRLLGWSRVQSAFAGLVWGSFPIILLQSTTCQLDLVAAGIFMPAIYFLVLGVRKENRVMLVYSGLSLALAMGTKQTLFLLLPGLGLFAIILYKYWKRHFSHLLLWIGSTVVFFLAMSSFIFVVNTLYYHTPFGQSDIVEGNFSRNELQTLGLNIPRLAYQAVDFSGLPEKVSLRAYHLKDELASWFLNKVGVSIEGTQAVAVNHQFDLSYPTPVQEDESWFGILSVLLLFPAAIIEFIRGIREKDTIKIGLFTFSLTFLPVEILSRPGWDPYQSRYFITAVGMLAPFMARWVQKGIFSKVIVWTSAVLGIITMINIMAFNPAKPIIPRRVNIFKADRQVLQGIQSTYLSSYMGMVYSLPEKTVVGYYSNIFFCVYPLFGEHFERTVIPIMSLDSLHNVSFLKDQQIEYVVVDTLFGESFTVDPSMEVVGQEDNVWVLYKVP
jgi:hypothetical protein